MNLLRTNPWRAAFIASGVAMLIGGPMHPESDAKDSLREELATMTAHENWVPGHTLIVVSTLLLAVGLWTAHRRRSWPVGTRRTLKVAAVATTLELVETVFHLAAAVDSDHLHDGEAAPVAFTHVGLSIVLYPVAGAALVALAFTLLRHQRGLGRLPAVLGIVAGTLHALSVPLTLLLPDTELSPMFAGAAILGALWSITTGLTPFRVSRAAGHVDAAAEPELVLAGR